MSLSGKKFIIKKKPVGKIPSSTTPLVKETGSGTATSTSFDRTSNFYKQLLKYPDVAKAPHEPICGLSNVEWFYACAKVQVCRKIHQTCNDLINGSISDFKPFETRSPYLLVDIYKMASCAYEDPDFVDKPPLIPDSVYDGLSRFLHNKRKELRTLKIIPDLITEKELDHSTGMNVNRTPELKAFVTLFYDCTTPLNLHKPIGVYVDDTAKKNFEKKSSFKIKKRNNSGAIGGRENGVQQRKLKIKRKLKIAR
jgi:hypothetical protein